MLQKTSIPLSPLEEISSQRGSQVFRQEPRVKNFSQVGEANLLLDLIGISEQLEKYPGFEKQAEKIRTCGQSYSTFMCSCKFIKVRKRCDYIICPCCGKIRSERFYKKFADLVKSKKVARSIYDSGLRFLTLTIRNVEDVIEGVDKLYASFKKLRRRDYWKKRVFGGIGAIDMKKGQDGLWNIHIHSLIYSKHLDMKSHKTTGEDAVLVQEWKKCTGGDGILNIKRVRSRGGALRYILKYLAKGISDLSYEEKASFFKLTFKRRLLFTFGKKKYRIFYGVKIPRKKILCRDCHCSFQYVSPTSEEHEIAEAYFNKKEPPPDKLEYWT